MTIEIKSPTFPESVADGTVANWVKKEGESVDQDEIIAEIETKTLVIISEFLSPKSLPKKPEIIDASKGRNNNAISILSLQAINIFNINS